jgi:hypothetical protein
MVTALQYRYISSNPIVLKLRRITSGAPDCSQCCVVITRTTAQEVRAF